MGDKITWTNEKRKLSELIPWPRNPRQITRDQGKRLVESYEEFAQFETIAIGPSNEVYNGHQRLQVWGEQYGPDFEIDVRVASRALTEKERERLTILAHKGASGEWNWDTLANEFEVDELLDWGFNEKELQLGGFDMPQEAETGSAQEIPEQYMIIVECDDEQTQAELLDRFNVEGLKCRALIS